MAEVEILPRAGSWSKEANACKPEAPGHREPLSLGNQKEQLFIVSICGTQAGG